MDSNNIEKPSSSKPSYPSVSRMILTAIDELGENRGSSLRAIQKYIVANYPVNKDRIGTNIKKSLKSAIAAEIVITKTNNLTGSFKLSAKGKKEFHGENTTRGKPKKAPPKKKNATTKVEKEPKKPKAGKETEKNASKAASKPKSVKKSAKVKPADEAKPKVKKTLKTGDTMNQTSKGHKTSREMPKIRVRKSLTVIKFPMVAKPRLSAKAKVKTSKAIKKK